MAIFYTAGLTAGSGRLGAPEPLIWKRFLRSPKSMIFLSSQMPLPNCPRWKTCGLYQAGGYRRVQRRQDLRGRNPGLMVGRRTSDALYEIGNPNHGPGRMFKVGRESPPW